jgi:hypothetical protein
MRNQLSLAITDAIMMVLAVGFWTITGRTPKCSQERVAEWLGLFSVGAPDAPA